MYFLHYISSKSGPEKPLLLSLIFSHPPILSGISSCGKRIFFHRKQRLASFEWKPPLLQS
ncbi:MAG: hypothetical protein EGR47_00595 [Clostridium sp.]|nr:hypothetical protein [Clostridium sp.]